MSEIGLKAGGFAAVLTRLLEQPLDAAQLMALQERLQRHGAELQGQLPELLLRSPNPEEAVRHWLADKDLSHWWPQAQGGTAAQGWQFESAGWNRSRGAEAMTPAEIVRAHGDGGLDALINPGVAADMAGHCAEAALLAAAIAVAAEVLKHRQAWRTASSSERKDLLQQAVRAAGLSALSGAGLSLVVSLALALVPGGQIWLMAATIGSATRLLPGAGDKAFDLQAWRTPTR
jgi:hypothetical protein